LPGGLTSFFPFGCQDRKKKKKKKGRKKKKEGGSVKGIVFPFRPLKKKGGKKKKKEASRGKRGATDLSFSLFLHGGKLGKERLKFSLPFFKGGKKSEGKG